MSSNGDPYFKDFEHMRPFYAQDTATFIDETLLIEPGVKQAGR
jgi:hypothetical protein